MYCLVIRDRNVLNIAEQVSCSRNNFVVIFAAIPLKLEKVLGTLLKRGKRESRIRRSQIHKIERKLKAGEYMKARGRRWRKGSHPSFLAHFNSVPLLIAR